MSVDASRENEKSSEALNKNGNSNEKSSIDSEKEKHASPKSHSLEISRPRLEIRSPLELNKNIGGSVSCSSSNLQPSAYPQLSGLKSTQNVAHAEHSSKSLPVTTASNSGFDNIPPKPKSKLTGAGAKRKKQLVIAGVPLEEARELAKRPLAELPIKYKRMMQKYQNRVRSPIVEPRKKLKNAMMKLPDKLVNEKQAYSKSNVSDIKKPTLSDNACNSFSSEKEIPQSGPGRNRLSKTVRKRLRWLLDHGLPYEIAVEQAKQTINERSFSVENIKMGTNSYIEEKKQRMTRTHTRDTSFNKEEPQRSPGPKSLSMNARERHRSAREDRFYQRPADDRSKERRHRGNDNDRSYCRDRGKEEFRNHSPLNEPDFRHREKSADSYRERSPFKGSGGPNFLNKDESVYSRGIPHRERSPLYKPGFLNMEELTYPERIRDRDRSPFYGQEDPRFSSREESAYPGHSSPKRSFHVDREQFPYPDDNDDVESIYARRRNSFQSRRETDSPNTGESFYFNRKITHSPEREEFINRSEDRRESRFSNGEESYSGGNYLPIVDREEANPQHPLLGEKMPNFYNKDENRHESQFTSGDTNFPKSTESNDRWQSSFRKAFPSFDKQEQLSSRHEDSSCSKEKEATLASNDWQSSPVKNQSLYKSRENLPSGTESNFPAPEDSDSRLRNELPKTSVSPFLPLPTPKLMPELNMRNIVHPNPRAVAAAAAVPPMLPPPPPMLIDHPFMQPIPQGMGGGLMGFAPHPVDQIVRFGPPAPLDQFWPPPMLPHPGLPMGPWPVGELMPFPPFPGGVVPMLSHAIPQTVSMPSPNNTDSGIPSGPTRSSSDHAGSSFDDSSHSKSHSKQRSSINITVAHANYPHVHLSEEQMELTENLLFDAILVQRDSDVRPAFTGSVHKKGCIVFTCADEDTVRWLNRVVPSLIPWRGAKLKTLDSSFENDEIIDKMVFLQIPNYVLSDKAILKALKAQNAALNTELWKVVYRQRNQSGFQLTIKIDLKSYEALERSNYSAFFKYSKVKFQPATINLGKTKYKEYNSK